MKQCSDNTASKSDIKAVTKSAEIINETVEEKNDESNKINQPEPVLEIPSVSKQEGTRLAGRHNCHIGNMIQVFL